MPIDHLVKALNNNQFRASQIKSFDDFLDTYDGLNLLDHIAKKKHALALLNETLDRAVVMLDYKIYDEDSFESMKDNSVLQLCHTLTYNIMFEMSMLIVAEYPDEDLKKIVKKPSLVFNFFNTSNITYTMWLFLKPALFPTIIGLMLRVAWLKVRVGGLMKDCSSIKDLKAIIPMLAELIENQPFGDLYKESLLSEKLLKNIAKEPQAQLNTLLDNIVLTLSVLPDKNDYSQLSVKTANTCIETLCLIFTLANPVLRRNLAKIIERLIRDHKNSDLFLNNSDYVFTVVKESHSIISPKLFEMISPETNMILLNKMKLHFENKNERVYINNIVNKIATADSDTDLELVFHFNDSTKDGEVLLSQFLSYANLPQVKRLCFAKGTFHLDNRNEHSLAFLANSSKVRIENDPDNLLPLRYALSYSNGPVKMQLSNDARSFLGLSPATNSLTLRNGNFAASEKKDNVVAEKVKGNEKVKEQENDGTNVKKTARTASKN